MERNKENLNTSFLIKILSNSFSRRMNQELQEEDLTFSQGNVLGYLCVRRNEEVNPMDIEREFELKKPTVTGLLQRLEQKGFIILSASEKGKKYKRISLTEKALDHTRQVDETAYRLEQELFQGISEEEIENFRKILFKMLDNIT